MSHADSRGWHLWEVNLVVMDGMKWNPERTKAERPQAQDWERPIFTDSSGNREEKMNGQVRDSGNRAGFKASQTEFEPLISHVTLSKSF